MRKATLFVCTLYLFSVTFLGITLPALGQSDRANISGVVQDLSDARIANANVKLVNTDTRTEANSKTNTDGIFAITGVMPGHYTLQIEREGFETTQLTGITLNVGDKRDVVIRMKVGTSRETVNV